MNPGGRQILAWGGLLARTYGLYRNRFRTLFLIALAPAVLAYLCTFLQRALFNIIRAQGWVPRWRSPGYWALLTTIALFEGAVYWSISGFFFGGVASNVLREPGSEEPYLSDAFSMPRKRIGSIVTVTLMIWAAFALGREIAGLALVTILDRLGLLQNSALFTIAFGLMLLLLCGLLSRLGLAIPILVDNSEISVRQSLRLSLIKTENWEPFFMLFLAKSAVIGYAAYWIANFGLNNLFNRGMLPPEAFPWVQALFYICLAAMLESPLFIAFSLLYHESKALPQEAAAAAPLS
jgi:hypothetical protein